MGVTNGQSFWQEPGTDNVLQWNGQVWSIEANSVLYVQESPNMDFTSESDKWIRNENTVADVTMYFYCLPGMSHIGSFCLRGQESHSSFS